jgi:hypothetical protein
MHYLEFEVKKNVAFCMFLLNKKKTWRFYFSNIHEKIIKIYFLNILKDIINVLQKSMHSVNEYTFRI